MIGDLVQRVGIGQQRGDDGVAGLVVGAVHAIELAQHDRPALDAHQDLVARRFEIRAGHGRPSGACGNERGLIHEVGEVRS